jgi:hypothetical protein
MKLSNIFNCRLRRFVHDLQDRIGVSAYLSPVRQGKPHPNINTHAAVVPCSKHFSVYLARVLRIVN